MDLPSGLMAGMLPVSSRARRLSCSSPSLFPSLPSVSQNQHSQSSLGNISSLVSESELGKTSRKSRLLGSGTKQMGETKGPKDWPHRCVTATTNSSNVCHEMGIYFCFPKAHTKMSIGPFLMMLRNWKQPNYPETTEWINYDTVVQWNI